MRQYVSRALRQLLAAMVQPAPRAVSNAMFARLADGEKCEGQAFEPLVAEMERRLMRAELAHGVSLPQFTDLRFRMNGLPEWWTAGNNVFLAGPDVPMPNFQTGFGHRPATNSILVMGQGSVVRAVNFADHESMIAVGDNASLRSSMITAVAGGAVFIGENTSATAWSSIDARNDGLITVGADGMWANGVNIMTDDMHAIRDLATGQRINRRGGKVVIGTHVWLGMDVRVLGDAHIGEHSVVGLSSLVRNVSLPANSISAGQPARVVRTGITWTREDLP